MDLKTTQEELKHGLDWERQLDFREEVVSLKFVAPAARFAVDAYVNFARRASWQESIASSLTELFALIYISKG